MHRHIELSRLSAQFGFYGVAGGGNGTDLRVKALSYVGFKAPYDLNHKAHKEHKGKEKLFFVLFVCFVVPFFSGPIATPSIAGMINGMSREVICHNLEDGNSLLATNLQPCRNIDDKFLPAASPTQPKPTS